MKKKIFIGLFLLCILIPVTLYRMPIKKIESALTGYAASGLFQFTEAEMAVENYGVDLTVDLPFELDPGEYAISNFVYYPNLEVLAFGIFHHPDIELLGSYEVFAVTVDGEFIPFTYTDTTDYVYQEIDNYYLRNINVDVVEKIVVVAV